MMCECRREGTPVDHFTIDNYDRRGVCQCLISSSNVSSIVLASFIFQMVHQVASAYSAPALVIDGALLSTNTTICVFD